MVKKRKWQYYGVRRIAGVRTEPSGEVRYLVKWNGYSSMYDTWEPMENLTNVEDMVKDFLAQQGLKESQKPADEIENEVEIIEPMHAPRPRPAVKTDTDKPHRRAEFLTFQATHSHTEHFPVQGQQRRSFPTLKLQPGKLGIDRPVKIIGARGNGGSMEYAVLFAPSQNRYVGVGVVSHAELVAKAPWLFARYFLPSLTKYG